MSAPKPMRVLVATDGSAAADTAVDLVGGVDWPAGTEIHVVQVVELGPALFDGPWPTIAALQMDEIEERVRAEASRSVQAACDRLSGEGRLVQAAVLEGRPATAIVERAAAIGADLIVVGSRGHGAISTLLLGSVSAEIVDHATTPVLVARGTRLERVVLAWDGSQCAARAADLLRWPIFGRATVRVVSVAAGGAAWWMGLPAEGSPEVVAMYLEAAEESRVLHERLAGEMTAELRTAGLDAEAQTREGDPGAEILAAAREHSADLIVMGTHGRTGLTRLVLGSVARNVLQHAPCSILIVRECAPTDSEPAA